MARPTLRLRLFVVLQALSCRATPSRIKLDLACGLNHGRAPKPRRTPPTNAGQVRTRDIERMARRLASGSMHVGLGLGLLVAMYVLSVDAHTTLKKHEAKESCQSSREAWVRRPCVLHVWSLHWHGCLAPVATRCEPSFGTERPSESVPLTHRESAAGRLSHVAIHATPAIAIRCHLVEQQRRTRNHSAAQYLDSRHAHKASARPALLWCSGWDGL